jgi:hypothetical protein
MTAIGDPKPDWSGNKLMELKQLPTEERSSRGINSAAARLAPPLTVLFQEGKPFSWLQCSSNADAILNWEVKFPFSE